MKIALIELGFKILDDDAPKEMAGQASWHRVHSGPFTLEVLLALATEYVGFGRLAGPDAAATESITKRVSGIQPAGDAFRVSIPSSLAS